MFAVIKTGGKQYKVAKGDTLFVEKLPVSSNDEISFDKVLLVSLENEIKVGTPLVNGATVKANVIDQVKDEKVIIFKKRRRKNYRRKNGHRQPLTKLKITEIIV